MKLGKSLMDKLDMPDRGLFLKKVAEESTDKSISLINNLINIVVQKSSRIILVL